MRKSSVYLSDAQKQDLAAAASATGRSEAELIRDAVAREVRRSRGEGGGRARRPLPAAPCLIGVGVGPGDPALVTGAAREVIAAADRVLAASIDPAAVGRAEAVVRAVDPEVDVERLVLDASTDRDARAQRLAAAAERIAGCLDAGELVAFAVLGDPHLWSPWPGLRRAVLALRPAASTAAVAGIMAWQDLAARTGTVVAEDDEKVVLVCIGDDAAAVCGPAADARTTVVGYRGGAALPAVAAGLGERADDAVVGELLGQPGERVVPLTRAATRVPGWLATTLVPARRPPQ